MCDSSHLPTWHRHIPSHLPMRVLSRLTDGAPMTRSPSRRGRTHLPPSHNPSLCSTLLQLRLFPESVPRVPGLGRSSLKGRCFTTTVLYVSSKPPQLTWAFCCAGPNKRGLGVKGLGILGHRLLTSPTPDCLSLNHAAHDSGEVTGGGMRWPSPSTVAWADPAPSPKLDHND